MTTRKPPSPSASKELVLDDLKHGREVLSRRLEELRAVDPNAVQSFDDQDLKNLRMKTNRAIADLFGDGTREYRDFAIGQLIDMPPMTIGYGTGHRDPVPFASSGLKKATRKLETVIEMLDEKMSDIALRETGAAVAQLAAGPTQPNRQPTSVFIVHGHDGEAKQEAARLIGETHKLQPVILHERANEGRTIIEKFEDHASEASFAIVLLTADDMGHPKNDSSKARPRGRQNVVFEMGFFFGTLGRKRTVVLHDSDVELPSDIHGLVYIPRDPGGAWKYAVTKELRAAGFKVSADDIQ